MTDKKRRPFGCGQAFLWLLGFFVLMAIIGQFVDDDEPVKTSSTKRVYDVCTPQKEKAAMPFIEHFREFDTAINWQLYGMNTIAVDTRSPGWIGGFDDQTYDAKKVIINALAIHNNCTVRRQKGEKPFDSYTVYVRDLYTNETIAEYSLFSGLKLN